MALECLAQDANGALLDTFTHPWSDGTTGIRLSPVELLAKLAALVPLPRTHLVRYGGCLAPHSHLRGAIIPTPRQQGVDEEATDTRSPRWSWARLLKCVFALDMAHRPSDVSPHTARGWGDLAVRRQRLPSAPCCCPCAASHAVATSCTLARLSLRPCSLCLHVCKSLKPSPLETFESVASRPRRRRTASAGNLPGRRTAARWRGWGVAPGARGVSAPRRAHHAGRPQQQREGGQGAGAGSRVRGGCSTW